MSFIEVSFIKVVCAPQGHRDAPSLPWVTSLTATLRPRLLLNPAVGYCKNNQEPRVSFALRHGKESP
ncbi:hypothetical protein PROH_03500 [Prochlorothrix hollandica PCC 9006 = CALU 1027]|uniref:Uncharacterized protein n=2 Tax=Prochlorothrix hollandica TaxID=1223 RepID=A0A0M2PZ40_PROHO|nr:hypothetical protein PROH_12785 [Prochlorothrix hollandica PCC 9006 = CALU 1027]KKJ01415.1 hypothetical protein PROH_03500 [Prochlorothrix hollandica PCC 9006 = CALU 1027]